MHKSTRRMHLIEASLRICICLIVLFTQASAFSLPRPFQNCEAELVSKRTLESWNVTHDDLNHWLTQSNTASVMRATAALAAELKTAPAPALTLISMLSYTRLGDADAEKTLLRHFRQFPFIRDVEIILGRDIKDLVTPLTNLYFAERFVSGDAKAWLRKVLHSPVATILIADAMTKMPTPVMGEPFYLFKVGLNLSRWREIIFRFRHYDSTDLHLDEITRANPLMAFNMAKLIYATTLNKSDVYKVFNTTGAHRSIRDNDIEAMIEWVADKLTNSPTVQKDIPDSWAKMYRLVDSTIKTSTAKWPKLTDKELKGYTSGDLLLVDLVPSLIRAIDFESGGDLLDDISKSNRLSEELRKVLVTAPGNELYRSSDAALIANLILTLANVKRPTAGETRSLLKEQTAFIIQEMVKLSPPPSTQAPESANLLATTEEVDSFADLNLEQTYAIWVPYKLSESPALADSVLSGEPLDAFIDGSQDIKELQPNTGYEITFARPNGKFSGPQKIVFSAKGLEQILNFQSKEVTPLSWLKAIKMGIAKSHGQRGIKILSFFDGDATFIEVKLLQTSYRILGRFHNGVWFLETLVDTHP